MIAINKVLTFWITWIYVSINIIVTFTPIPGILLLAIRELWIFIFMFILLRERLFLQCYIICFFLIAGIAHLTFNPMTSGPMSGLVSLVYFLRDICLIFFVINILISAKTFLDQRMVESFIVIVFVVAAVEVITKFYDPLWFYNFVDVDGHLEAKGVRAQFGFGLIGLRTVGLFYSPNLLGTFLSCLFIYYCLSEKRWSYYKGVVAIFIGVFTGTKVVLLAFGYIFCKIFKSLAGIYFLLAIFGSVSLISYLYYDVVRDPLLRYHLASTLGHFHSFSSFADSFQYSVFVDFPGYNSTTIRVLNAESLTGVESLLLARFLDMRLISLPFVMYLAFIWLKLRYLHWKLAFVYGLFIMIILFTATSNLPVAYVPLALISFHLGTREVTINE